MDEKQRWPRQLLRDLDALSLDRHDPAILLYKGPRPPSYCTYSKPKLVRFRQDLHIDTTMAVDLHGVNRHQSTRKSLVLCFDGTGNKFSGTAADSNILKIYSMLDKEDPNVYRYYQPGIGTYVEQSSLATKSRYGRVKSWYTKAKDQAVGTSFGEHVMAGYKFLMRYYSAGDDIYFFGFSRGAYTARFLAQMLDYIGLLSTGNEEMLRFAWKTFSRWQTRTDSNAKEKKEKRETFHFMERFRETFSRPIDTIRFVGLFDCVNSVPQFESAWMKRSRFPYTAKMSARTIRHAVAIDERRAKFRQDLVSEQREVDHHRAHHPLQHLAWHHGDGEPMADDDKLPNPPKLTHRSSTLQARFRPRRRKQHLNAIPASSAASQVSVDSAAVGRERLAEHRGDESIVEEEDEQDIVEVWFSGQHGDIGGGWSLSEGEERPASDLPLIWMLREAKRAGMPLDEAKLAKAQFNAGERISSDGAFSSDKLGLPVLEIDGNPLPGGVSTADDSVTASDVHYLATKTRLHDSLALGGGLAWSAVLAWYIMEHLPFRRMDLQPDGSWKPIVWPLPRGEVRDIPENAVIHGSVIQRMEADSNYRPGNVIIGGGGRGVRKAPESAGIGQWSVARERGDPVGEAVIRTSRTLSGKTM